MTGGLRVFGSHFFLLDVTWHFERYFCPVVKKFLEFCNTTAVLVSKRSCLAFISSCFFFFYMPSQVLCFLVAYLHFTLLTYCTHFPPRLTKTQFFFSPFLSLTHSHKPNTHIHTITNTTIFKTQTQDIF